MGLIKLNRSDDLDIKNVDLKGEHTSRAYLITGTAKYSEKMSDDFITFYFKDVNGLPVTGYWFRPRVEDLGYFVGSLRHKPVLVDYSIGTGLGHITLNITGIREYNGTDFPFDKYLSKVAGLDEDVEHIERVVAKYDLSKERGMLPLDISTSDSTWGICGGAVGGKTKLLAMVLREMESYAGLPNIDMQILLSTAVRSMAMFFEYMDIANRMSVPLKAELLRSVIYFSEDPNIVLANTYGDAISSVIGIGEPSLLYSHLVVDSIKKNNKNLNLSYDLTLVVRGSTTKREGVLLSKL